MEERPEFCEYVIPWFVNRETASGYYTQPGVGSKLLKKKFSTHWASGQEELRLN
jgi:hypothetical protein